MIWWLWTAYNPPLVFTFNVNANWEFLDEPEPDVYWLGEIAWTARHDNMGIGLK